MSNWEDAKDRFPTTKGLTQQDETGEVKTGRTQSIMLKSLDFILEQQKPLRVLKSWICFSRLRLAG